MAEPKPDEFQVALTDYLRGLIRHACVHHDVRVNAVMIPITIWENAGRPSQLGSKHGPIKVIPFDDASGERSVWVGVIPEGAKL